MPAPGRFQIDVIRPDTVCMRMIGALILTHPAMPDMIPPSFSVFNACPVSVNPTRSTPALQRCEGLQPLRTTATREFISPPRARLGSQAMWLEPAVTCPDIVGGARVYMILTTTAKCRTITPPSPALLHRSEYLTSLTTRRNWTWKREAPSLQDVEWSALPEPIYSNGRSQTTTRYPLYRT